MMRSRFIVATFVVLLFPAVTLGQNREHLQMNADIRILQESVSRLQLRVNQLAEQQDDLRRRVDEAANATTKGFADQQLLINQLAATVTTVRERLDDNTVRVSQLSQEFVAIREGMRLLTDRINTLVGLLQPEAAPSSAASGSADAPSGAAPLPPVVLPPSAGRIYSQALGDYRSGRYDNAIEGFREVIEMYPDAPDAANAQFQIGESLYHKKDCRGAVPEYQKFIDSYASAERRPDGIFMLGVCYSDLKQTTNARRMFEQVLKEYPESTAALQARQRLEGLGIRQ